jgi:hypothetical protein
MVENEDEMAGISRVKQVDEEVKSFRREGKPSE